MDTIQPKTVLESAKIIFKEKIKDNILSVVDKSKGANHHVYIFYCENNNYVIRMPLKETKSKLVHEAWALEKWYSQGIKVPKIYHAEPCIIIEEFIDGLDLEEMKLSQEEYKKLYFEIGAQIKKMHSVKTKNYGFFNEYGIGQFESWHEFLENDFMENLNTICDKNLITEELKKEMIEYFESRKDCLNYSDPRLLHSDLAENNIIVSQKNKLKGIIDASDSISGDPMYDLAIMYYNNQKRFRFMAEGYGKENINMNKIKFYTFYHLVWLFHFHSKNQHFMLCQKDVSKIMNLMRKNELKEDMTCVDKTSK
jgi:aminoglycoside phosphotransferase (APT) family kinase protein